MEAIDHELPIYIPHTKVCHMEQYQCCTHRKNCRLRSRCEQIQTSILCIHDCPSCMYSGCSLSEEDRRTHPVYRDGIIQGNRVDVHLEIRKMAEQFAHRRNHARLYSYYNTIFGDYRQKRNAAQRRRYWENPEKARAAARKSYRKCYKPHPVNRNSQYLPQCKFDCVNCPHKDCVVPENWYKQIYGQKYYAEHPDYFQTYRETHKAERANYNKMWYRKNRDSKLARQREHRSDPSVKKERAVYDKKWRKEHPELERAKRKRYYEKHREEINARKREKRAATKMSA